MDAVGHVEEGHAAGGGGGAGDFFRGARDICGGTEQCEGTHASSIGSAMQAPRPRKSGATGDASVHWGFPLAAHLERFAFDDFENEAGELVIVAGDGVDDGIDHGIVGLGCAAAQGVGEHLL